MIKKDLKKPIYHNILYGLFLLIFLLEPIVNIFPAFTSHLRAKAIVKLLLLVMLFSCALTLKINRKALIMLFCLILSFVIGQYLLPKSYSIFQNDLIEEIKSGDIYIMVKYLYIIFFVAIYEKIIFNDHLTDRLLNLFNKFMIINTVFIGIGLITHWELLRTYPYSERFGYQGIMELAGESIHLYTIAITLAYINYIKTTKWATLIILIIGGVLLGKKAIFIYLVLLFLVHLFYIKKKKTLYVIGFLITCSIIFYRYIAVIFIKIFPFWQSLYDTEGLTAVIFSARNLLFERSLDYIHDNWVFLNYIFGGMNFSEYRSEFGFFDLFLAVGLLGTIIYICFIYKYLISKQSYLVKAIFIIIFIVDGFSGGLIINVMPMIFLYLVAKKLESKPSTTIKTVNNN